MNSVKISKIHKTESSVPLELEVDLEFRDQANMVASRNVSNGFLDFENINSVGIVKIHRIVLKLKSKVNP